MFSDLLVFKTPKCQRAAMMVALLQLVLKKAGNVEDAQRLEGMDVTNPEMAQVAIEVLSGLRAYDTETASTRASALDALYEATRPDAPQAYAAN